MAAALILAAFTFPTAGQQPPPQSSTAPAASAPQDPAAGQAPPTFRSIVSYVRVDVIVTDKRGQPVVDLTPADFEVFEDNRKQQVDAFKLIRTDGYPKPGDEAPRQIRSDHDEEIEAQREDARVFVFVLDDYHVRRGTAMSVRQPLINFIRTQLGPLDLVAVMYPLTPVTALRLTRNHEAVVRAIEQFEGRKGDYRPRNEFEERYSLYPVDVVERVRNQVSLSALEGLAVRLGNLRDGRKAIVLVSEGYSHYVPPQLRDGIAELGPTNPGARNPTASEGFGQDRERFLADVDIQTDMRRVYDACNRANAAIYAVDPRGLAVFEYDINQPVLMQQDTRALTTTQDSLRILAENSDGRAIVNQNDLTTGMKQLVQDSSAYYLLGYDSSHGFTDGKFHEIKVRVKRAGVDVRHRKGYWAVTADDAKRAAAPARPTVARGITEALSSIATSTRPRAARTWIGTAPSSTPKTRVSLVWEAMTPPTGDRRPVVARAAIVAVGDGGTPVFRARVPEGDAGTGVAAGTAAAPMLVQFDAPPGRLQVRLSFESASGALVDTDTIDLDVPDYTAPTLAMTPLAVLRGRTNREFQQLLTDERAVPQPGRDFRRTDRLLVRFYVRSPGDAAVPSSASLLNRSGQKMSDVAVQPPATATGAFSIDLPLASLAPGEYVLEVRAGEGEAAVKQFVGLRVSS